MKQTAAVSGEEPKPENDNVGQMSGVWCVWSENDNVGRMSGVAHLSMLEHVFDARAQPVSILHSACQRCRTKRAAKMILVPHGGFGGG